MPTLHASSVMLVRRIGTADVESAISHYLRVAARRYESVVVCRKTIAQIMSSEAVRPTLKGRSLD